MAGRGLKSRGEAGEEEVVGVGGAAWSGVAFGRGGSGEAVVASVAG
jgi:hypothetical protein